MYELDGVLAGIMEVKLRIQQTWTVPTYAWHPYICGSDHEQKQREILFNGCKRSIVAVTHINVGIILTLILCTQTHHFCSSSYGHFVRFFGNTWRMACIGMKVDRGRFGAAWAMSWG